MNAADLNPKIWPRSADRNEFGEIVIAGNTSSKLREEFGTPLYVYDADEIYARVEALEWHPKVGVCLDTCHVFAAGHDIKSKGGMIKTLDLLVEVAGAERIQLIHANDSMDVLGSLKDRHANLGEGEKFKVY